MDTLATHVTQTRPAPRLNAKVLGYWACTVLVSLSLLTSGAGHLTHMKQSVDGIMALGYPLYFITLLGFWKVAGGLTLLAPGLPRLKEWAYAGVCFDFT